MLINPTCMLNVDTTINNAKKVLQEINTNSAKRYKYYIDSGDYDMINDHILQNVAEGGYIHDYGFEGVDEGYEPYYEYLKQDLENRKNNIYEDNQLNIKKYNTVIDDYDPYYETFIKANMKHIISSEPLLREIETTNKLIINDLEKGIEKEKEFMQKDQEWLLYYKERYNDAIKENEPDFVIKSIEQSIKRYEESIEMYRNMIELRMSTLNNYSYNNPYIQPQYNYSYDYNNAYYPQYEYIQPQQYNYSYDYNNYYTPYSYEYDPYIDYYNNGYNTYNDNINTTVDLTNDIEEDIKEDNNDNNKDSNMFDRFYNKFTNTKKKIINYISNYRPVYNSIKGIIEPVLIE